MSYRIGFVDIALEEINDSLSDTIRYNAISHKGSKLEGKEFTDFVKDETEELNKPPMVVDHEAQMTQAERN